MASVSVETIVAGLKDYFASPEMAALIDKLKNGGFLSKISAGIAIAMEAIVVAEKLAADIDEIGTGGAKKEAITKWLDDVVDLPFYLEPIDGMVFGMAVDAIVGYYNVKFGHNWVGAVKKFLLGEE